MVCVYLHVCLFSTCWRGNSWVSDRALKAPWRRWTDSSQSSPVTERKLKNSVDKNHLEVNTSKNRGLASFLWLHFSKTTREFMTLIRLSCFNIKQAMKAQSSYLQQNLDSTMKKPSLFCKCDNIQRPLDSHWGLTVGHRCDYCCLACRASSVWLLWKSSRAEGSRCPWEKRWCRLNSRSPLVCSAQPEARRNAWAGVMQRESDPRSPHLQMLDPRHECLEDKTSWGWVALELRCPFSQAEYRRGWGPKGGITQPSWGGDTEIHKWVNIFINYSFCNADTRLYFCVPKDRKQSVLVVETVWRYLSCPSGQLSRSCDSAA